MNLDDGRKGGGIDGKGGGNWDWLGLGLGGGERGLKGVGGGWR